MERANVLPGAGSIREVTVYLSGAQITRSYKVDLEAGKQVFTFGGLPADINTGSIQVAAEGVDILSVEHRLNRLESPEKTKESEAVLKRLEDIIDERAKEKSKIELCQLEEEFLNRNSSLSGTETGIKAEELKSALMLYN